MVGCILVISLPPSLNVTISHYFSLQHTFNFSSSSTSASSTKMRECVDVIPCCLLLYAINPTHTPHIASSSYVFMQCNQSILIDLGIQSFKHLNCPSPKYRQEIWLDFLLFFALALLSLRCLAHTSTVFLVKFYIWCERGRGGREMHVLILILGFNLIWEIGFS